MSKLPCLSKIYDEINQYEIGIDEAGRGPLFGRLYVAAAVLPKDNTFQHEKMRDSKTIKSRKKIQEIAQYIKENAAAWHIHYIEASVIDTINIRQSVLMAMHECAKQVIIQLNTITPSDPHIAYEHKYMLLVDGNDFTPHMIYDETTQSMREVQHETIEGGDNKYTCIAAASILAKNERDTYMEELCNTYPVLNERYGLAKNMGYGTKTHIAGITQYGITQWHRKTYGICKTSDINIIPEETYL
uniref:Ribonuclease HII n=1 Tax=viral metagenome TaxID=1070528 RepID=A0A6C0JZ88_9ZZZZ